MKTENLRKFNNFEDISNRVSKGKNSKGASKEKSC